LLLCPQSLETGLRLGLLGQLVRHCDTAETISGLPPDCYRRETPPQLTLSSRPSRPVCLTSRSNPKRYSWCPGWSS
jgi:hypothetical protein